MLHTATSIQPQFSGVHIHNKMRLENKLEFVITPGEDAKDVADGFEGIRHTLHTDSGAVLYNGGEPQGVDSDAAFELTSLSDESLWSSANMAQVQEWLAASVEKGVGRAATKRNMLTFMQGKAPEVTVENQNDIYGDTVRLTFTA